MARHENGLSRRTFLRGCGAAIGLPMLEVMRGATVRAESALRESAKTPRRAAFFYVPNGVVQETWHPGSAAFKTDEARVEEFPLTPTLEPLAKMREKVSLFTGLDRVKVHGTDGHAQAGACWLSSARPDELSPAGYPLKRTLDQLIAAETGKLTPFRSLELSCNPYQDNKESVYFDNVSWYGHGHAARSMRDPKLVFERIFNVEQQRSFASVLDLVMSDAKSLERRLGRIDQRKLDEYMDSVRTVERQIQRVHTRREAIDELSLEKPEIPYLSMRRDEYIQLMGDLMILAFRADLTRVVSLMVAPERWGTPLMVHGLFEKPVLHHNWTHDQGNPRVKQNLSKLDKYHVGQFARLVEKMDAIEEVDGSLLDSSLFLFGSGLSSGKTHVYSNLPAVVAGSGGGAMATNRHHRSAEGTPVGNLFLAMANSMGVKMSRYADSTESLRGFAG